MLSRNFAGGPLPGICQVFFSGLDRGPGLWGEEYRGEVPSAHLLRAHAVSVTDRCAVDLAHLAEVWLPGFPAGTPPQPHLSGTLWEKVRAVTCIYLNLSLHKA